MRILPLACLVGSALLALGCDDGVYRHADQEEVVATSSCPDDGSGYDARSQSLECQVLELVNEVRAKGTTCTGKARGPAPRLAMDSALRGAARAHAGDMATNGYFSHDSPDGRDPFDRIQDAGYAFDAAGENIAGGSASAEDTMKQWLTSKTGHCDNIMNPEFVHIGTGYAFRSGSELEHYWVQNFGSPR